MSTTHDLKVIGKLNKEIDLVVGNEPVLFVCSLEERPEEKYLVMTYNLFKGKYVIREITHQELLLMLENVLMKTCCLRRAHITKFIQIIFSITSMIYERTLITSTKKSTKTSKI